MEEDKKRTLDQSAALTNGHDEPQKKRPLLNNDANRRLSTQEPLGPLTVEDIAQFQKEAIFRQMKAYKRERDLLEDKSVILEKRYSSLEKSFISLDEWWVQLLDTLFPNGSSSSDEVVSLLQFSLNDVEEESDEFKENLEAKNTLIKARISAWVKSHPPNSSTEAEIKESLAKVSQALHSVRTQNQALVSSKSVLTAQVEDLKEKYLSAEKKLERYESPSVARVQQSVIKREDSTDEVDEKSSTDSGKDGNESGAAASVETLAELEKLKTALDNSEATVTKQNDHIKEFEAQISTLNNQIQSLNARLINLPKEDLEKSEIVRSLWLRNDELKKTVDTLKATNEKLDSERSKLRVGQEEFESKIRNEYRTKKESLEQQITKLEQDVARIRSARDDLLSEVNIKKAAESERKKAFEELNSLVSIREARIKTLEEEIARLKDQSDSTASLTKSAISEQINGAANDSDKLELAINLAEKLQRQNKSLLAELPGLEQAFAQAHAKVTSKANDVVEQEALVNKLKAEKVRADEKYFSAMRAKDQLTNENNRLKSQLNKSADLIQQLKELETTHTQTITSLRKQIDELNKAHESHNHDIQASKRSLSERQYRIDSASRHIEQLKEEVRHKTDAVKKEIDSRHSLEIEIEKLKRQVEAKRLTTAGGGSAAEEQLEALRSIAICSLCSKNWKDTAIKVCGHVFCSDCAKDRLNARLRKCPMCNKQYSFNDLLPVHL
ncbi:E3 ubiquitin-protein ligase BRE1 [Sugiyamaella lignohabitans]|uniref:E3 ubiquitin protein ligase n=1 Tax=Sugiyamaella lignohabitans TaxID=796027 RepID=A0A161HHN1_9ASCO|nr:E3 ubiquitin-protein ligase BRE1 [Sugiyamaella lignohabitans]ANB11707.1 E3 ubiquitin-protein ligase BRE1 [Sugiyamaella lignohabitans]